METDLRYRDRYMAAVAGPRKVLGRVDVAGPLAVVAAELRYAGGSAFVAICVSSEPGERSVPWIRWRRWEGFGGSFGYRGRERVEHAVDEFDDLDHELLGEDESVA